MDGILGIILEVVSRQNELDTNLKIQYTLCAIAMLGCLVWVVLKVFRKNRGKSQGGSCHGCALSQSCQSNRDKGRRRDNRGDGCNC